RGLAIGTDMGLGLSAGSGARCAGRSRVAVSVPGGVSCGLMVGAQPGPAGDGTEFHIPNMGRQHGGRYSCSFRPQSELFISSEPSDPVELVVAGEGGDSTFPLPAPHPVRPWWVFFPGGTPRARLCSDRAGIRPWETPSPSHVFPGRDLQALPAPRDGGGVRCWRDRRTERDRRAEDRMRRTRFVSPPLNAGLFVNPEGPYPKPSISVSPAGVIPVGGNVTIRCWQHHYPGLRIQLYRDGIWNYLNYTDPAGSEAEFPIPSVSREHGGSYQCRYSDISGTYSEPSDPVEIIVADPGLPRPAISLRPSSVPAPGANVTIRCEGPGRAVRFFLHKAGDLNLQEHVDPAGDWTEFRIPDVGRHHGGRYSCSYRPRSQPFVSSEPSDPMELLVAGEGPNSASRLPAPHADNRTPWGGDCSPVGRPEPGSVLSPRAQQRDTRPGNRDGVMGGVPGGAASQEPSPPPEPRGPSLARQICAAWGWVPGRYRALAGSVAEFPIPSVSREHGGSYRCLYTHRPGNYSEPCDPVEIIVAGEPGPASPLSTPPPARPQGVSTSQWDVQPVSVGEGHLCLVPCVTGASWDTFLDVQKSGQAAKPGAKLPTH
uniref:Ig-like domain-containing protein n=1 Tax=Pelusios castaneus TaxID=367368 RepID=A0A8C8SQ80_9SAUR